MENPTLELEAGKRYRVVWENLDGEAHNWVIEEMASYYCEVHPSSMRGDVTVSGGGGQSPTSTPTETATETPTSADEAGYTVSMVTEGSEYHFDPIVLAVEPGDTVEWVIESGAHSATAYEDRIPDGAETFCALPPAFRSYQSETCPGALSAAAPPSPIGT